MDWKRRGVENQAEAHLSPSRNNPAQSALQYDRYTIAWVCALHIEMAAARAMLDNIHEEVRHPNDPNSYTLGSIQEHNIVLACLPNAQYGTNNAAIVATNLKRSFPSIQLGLMVGIGGAAPNQADLRLGDIVVGVRVMQYDMGKAMSNGTVLRTATPRQISHSISTAVSTLRSKHEENGDRVPFILRERNTKLSGYGRPNESDRLFLATYQHVSQTDCSGCDQLKLVPRSVRLSVNPMIHYGAIGSGNQVIKDSMTRDTLAHELDVICFEMETAGLIDVLPCLPIRGICDYSDSHKSKEWQRYAAATAAAYAREFLEQMPASIVPLYSMDPWTLQTKHPMSIERREAFLQSLEFGQMNIRKISIAKAHSKTCHWFLDLSEYRSWLDSKEQANHHGLLWIKGKPGAGKSTIMKYLDSNTRMNNPSHSTMAVSFYFNARGEKLEKSVSGMYRSLLLQVLKTSPTLQTVLNNPKLVCYRRYDGPPSLEVLKELLFNAVLKSGSPQFLFFIDALDECDEQEVTSIIEFFEELTKACVDNKVQFRIAFSSRHYPYIHIRRGIQLTLEDQSGHIKDLDRYVQSKLDIRDDNMVQELLPQILKKAAGVFLWVVLAVKILNRESRRGLIGVRRRLSEVPVGLSELFRDVLTRDSDDLDCLLLSVLWVLCAKRPLTPQEYYHALWSGLALKELADPEMPPVEGRGAKERIMIYVTTSSKGLAEVTKANRPVVQFIHESVRDFLIKEGGLRQLWPDIGFDWEIPSHERLKECCWMYMNHQSMQSSVEKAPGKIAKSFPFLEYATEHMFYHADLAAAAIPQDHLLSQLSVSKWIAMANMFEKYKIRRYSVDASLPYILADRGYDTLIRTFPKQICAIRSPRERYSYPLFAALAGGHRNTALALLGFLPSQYDNVDSFFGLDSREEGAEFEGRTPLTWAIERNNTFLVNRLLSEGACVSEADTSGNTPLTMAFETYNVTMVNLLVEKGAVATPQMNESWIYRALCFDQPRIAKSLIEKRTDIAEQGYKFSEIIKEAVRRDHQEVVAQLIDKGLDPNVGGFEGWRPLAEAVRLGNEGMVKLLLRKGADPNLEDHKRLLPILEAVRLGYKDLTELLLDNGASLTKTNYEGCTPLLVASREGRLAVAKVLVGKGANPNSRTINGSTAIILASEYGHAEIVVFLIENGANLRDRKNDGSTPILVASKFGHEEIVNILLENGASLSDQSDNESTPILVASENGHRLVVKLLLNKGASVQDHTSDGLTPLQASLQGGYYEVSLHLIEHGADINSHCSTVSTPLCEAIENGDLGFSLRLIDMGADVNIPNINGKSPLDIAMDHDMQRLAAIIQSKGGKRGVDLRKRRRKRRRW